MMLLLCIFTLVATVLAAEQCDKKGILVYEDLGCVPEYGKDKKCPIKYTCQGLETSGDHCYFRGKRYEENEQVEEGLGSPSCDVGCVCRPGDTNHGFTCAILDCPEWLGVPLKFACYRTYSLDHCCSVGEICQPFDKIEKCVFNGKEYREGDRFYPGNCLACVCQKGFKGKLEEPFCRRTVCGEQLKRSFAGKINQSCAPFYTKGDSEIVCCPDSWICAEGSETIVGDAKSEETCKFGEKTLKVGQEFLKTNFTDGYGRSFAKIKCECEIPPLLKCTDAGNPCYKAATSTQSYRTYGHNGQISNINPNMQFYYGLNSITLLIIIYNVFDFASFTFTYAESL